MRSGRRWLPVGSAEKGRDKSNVEGTSERGAPGQRCGCVGLRFRVSFCLMQ